MFETRLRSWAFQASVTYSASRASESFNEAFDPSWAAVAWFVALVTALVTASEAIATFTTARRSLA